MANSSKPDSSRAPQWDDTRMETLMGSLLRVGVVVSASIVAVGGVLYLLHFGAEPPHHRIFRGEPADLRSVSGIVRACAHGDSRAIIQTGLLLLIATPVARVAFAAYAFGRGRDRLYVAISLVVLAALLYGLLAPYF